MPRAVPYMNHYVLLFEFSRINCAAISTTFLPKDISAGFFFKRLIVFNSLNYLAKLTECVSDLHKKTNILYVFALLMITSSSSK